MGVQPLLETQPKVEREGEKYWDFSFPPTQQSLAGTSHWPKPMRCPRTQESRNYSSRGSTSPIQSRAEEDRDVSEGKTPMTGPENLSRIGFSFEFSPALKKWWVQAFSGQERRSTLLEAGSSLLMILIVEIFHTLS